MSYFSLYILIKDCAREEEVTEVFALSINAKTFLFSFKKSRKSFGSSEICRTFASAFALKVAPEH